GHVQSAAIDNDFAEIVVTGKAQQHIALGVERATAVQGNGAGNSVLVVVAPPNDEPSSQRDSRIGHRNHSSGIICRSVQIRIAHPKVTAGGEAASAEGERAAVGAVSGIGEAVSKS